MQIYVNFLVMDTAIPQETLKALSDKTGKEGWRIQSVFTEYIKMMLGSYIYGRLFPVRAKIRVAFKDNQSKWHGVTSLKEMIASTIIIEGSKLSVYPPHIGKARGVQMAPFTSERLRNDIAIYMQALENIMFQKYLQESLKNISN